jgi:hypothetical protein
MSKTRTSFALASRLLGYQKIARLESVHPARGESQHSSPCPLFVAEDHGHGQLQNVRGNFYRQLLDI